MALYVPKTGLAMLPNMPSEVGPVAFVSQSGSLCTFVAGEGIRARAGVQQGGEHRQPGGPDGGGLLRVPGGRRGDGGHRVVPGGRARRTAPVPGAGALRVAEAGGHLEVGPDGRRRAGRALAHGRAVRRAAQMWSAMLRQVGALPAHDMDELLDLLVACRHVPRDGGRRMAILAGPGGPAVSASDACEENGLELPRLSAGTQEVLRGIIPVAGTSVRNPVDMGLVMLGAAEMYYRATEAAAFDPNVDAILAIGGSAGAASLAAYAAAMEEISQRTGKPIMQSSVGGEMPFERVFSDHGIATFGSPERALWAYARVTGHAP